MTLYLLCAPATLERDVWEALRNKKDFQRDQWLSEQEWYQDKLKEIEQ